MSAILEVIQQSCSLLLCNEPTTALSSKSICDLDDTEWDKLTRSDMAGELLEHLDKLCGIKNGIYIIKFN